MNIIKDTIENTIEVKNSKFITKIYYIESEQEVTDIIKETKKKYYDAKHNCYAYRIGFANLILKQSDDGEPKGTAGLPILNAITQNDLTNCLIIVTRYFGGVLLGASLLLRTYQDSALEAVKLCDIAKLINGKDIDLTFEYTYYNSIQNYVSSNKDKIIINKNDFDDNVHLSIYISNDILDDFISTVNDITKAKLTINNNKNIVFAKFKDEVKIITHE